MWGNGASEEELSHAKRQGAVSWRECMNTPTDLQNHSPCISKATNVGGKKLAGENSSSKFLNPDPWTRLIGRATEERIIVNGKTVTALLDTGSQVTHIILGYCQAMGIPIYPINQLVKIEGAGDAIEYVGFIEAELSFPMGIHVFKTEALLLALPTKEYQKRVPVTIGTPLTHMAVDSFGSLDENKLTTPWKNCMVCYSIMQKSAGQTNSKAHGQNYQTHNLATFFHHHCMGTH